jgi:DNA topoisomerase-1
MITPDSNKNVYSNFVLFAYNMQATGCDSLQTPKKRNNYFTPNEQDSMRALFIIEGKGKIPAVKSVLATLRRDCGLSRVEILATKGHIAQNPAGLTPLAVNQDWIETAYGVSKSRRTEVVAIQREAREADVVFIATDDDQEGDVIARDVGLFVVKEHPCVKRCRLRAIDTKSLRMAIRDAKPLDAGLAVKGDARRIVDRVVGGVLSDVSVAENKRPVGRVFSSALAALAASPAVLGTIRVAIPATDGGLPFVAAIPFNRTTDVERLSAAGRAAGRVGAQSIGTIAAPMNFADTVATASERYRIPIATAADWLQDAYECGMVTYPRAAARAISEDGLGVCKALAERNGCTFEAGRIPSFGESDPGSHESPRVLAPLDLGRASASGAGILAIATTIGRHVIEAGQNYRIEYPDEASIPEELREYAKLFSRSKMEGWISWKAPQSSGAIKYFSKEVALLRLMEENGLGRPSTWVGHIGTLLERRVVDDDLSLTAKGKDLLALAHERGLGAGFSAAIERVIDGAEGMSAAALAKQAVAVASNDAYEAIQRGLDDSADYAFEHALG